MYPAQNGRAGIQDHHQHHYRDTAMPTEDEYIQGRLRMSPFIRHRQASYEGVLKYAPQSRHLPCTTFYCFTSCILAISIQWTFHMDIPLFLSFSLYFFSFYHGLFGSIPYTLCPVSCFLMDYYSTPVALLLCCTVESDLFQLFPFHRKSSFFLG